MCQLKTNCSSENFFQQYELYFDQQKRNSGEKCRPWLTLWELTAHFFKVFFVYDVAVCLRQYRDKQGRMLLDHFQAFTKQQRISDVQEIELQLFKKKWECVP